MTPSWLFAEANASGMTLRTSKAESVSWDGDPIGYANAVEVAQQLFTKWLQDLRPMEALPAR